MAEIYRKSSLEKVSSPDQLDKMVKVTTTHSWLILLSVGLCVAAVFLWSFFGKLSDEVNVSGIYMQDTEIVKVYSNNTGHIDKHLVSTGDKVNKGDTIAIVSGHNVMSNYSGIVNEVSLSVGQLVNAETEILEIRVAKNNNDRIILSYVPLSTANSLKVGMKVDLASSSSDGKQNGQMKGVIKSIGTYGVSETSMYRRLGDNLLVQAFRNRDGAEPVIEVVIEPDKTVINEEKQLPDLTLMGIHIITKVYAPVKLLFGS